MANTLDEIKNARVKVICVSSDRPQIKAGRITCRGEGYCEVALERGETPLEGATSVIVDGGPGSGIRIKGLVVATTGSKFRVETEGLLSPDKRDFPRVLGGIQVHYRVLAGKESKSLSSAWVKGNREPRSKGTWRQPDPFMDFSGSGLKFDDSLHCKVGDELLLELQIPPARELWQATARVVRVDPMPPVEKDELDETRLELAPTHQIAVQFTHLPKEAIEALSAFTLRVQDALLASKS